MKATLQKDQESVEYIWHPGTFDGLVQIHMFDLNRDYKAFSIEQKTARVARMHWRQHVLLGFSRASK